jgi:hypothetical protein
MSYSGGIFDPLLYRSSIIPPDSLSFSDLNIKSRINIKYIVINVILPVIAMISFIFFLKHRYKQTQISKRDKEINDVIISGMHHYAI